MKPQVNAVRKSIKIALNLCDAATDVTAEYKLKIDMLKREKNERNT